MTAKQEHKWYCFATQPAPCPGYFPEDVLPCVCDDPGGLRQVLGQLFDPSVPAIDDHPVLLPAA